MRAHDPHRPDQASVLRFYDGLGPAYGALRERGFLGWLARRDIRALWELLALPAQPAGLSALDVGCGAGLHARLLAEQGLRVCATDLSPRMVESVRPHVAEALVGDVDTLDLQRTFDRVLCCGVLDFVRDPARCVHNLARHVAPGGRLVLMVPLRNLGGRAYGLWHRLENGIRVHLYRAKELDAVARAAGLTAAGQRQPFLHSLLIAWERR